MPASNTAVRVSLPFTMSNIFRSDPRAHLTTTSKPVIEPGLFGGEARGICRALNPVNRLFYQNFWPPGRPHILAKQGPLCPLWRQTTHRLRSAEATCIWPCRGDGKCFLQRLTRFSSEERGFGRSAGFLDVRARWSGDRIVRAAATASAVCRLSWHRHPHPPPRCATSRDRLSRPLRRAGDR